MALMMVLSLFSLGQGHFGLLLFGDISLCSPGSFEVIILHDADHVVEERQSWLPSLLGLVVVTTLNPLVKNVNR